MTAGTSHQRRSDISILLVLPCCLLTIGAGNMTVITNHAWVQRELMLCWFFQKLGVMKKNEHPASLKYFEELKERPGYKKATAE